MSEYYGILQSVVRPPVSRVTQQYRISHFNTRGRVRGGRGCSRGHGGISYGHGHCHGRDGQGGCGGRIYGQNPYEFSSRYGTLVAEARVYSADQFRLLSSQQNNNIQEMKVREGWRGFDVPPECYKLDNEGKPVVDQYFVHNLNS